MPRQYQHEVQSNLPSGKDIWEMIRAADAYLRLKLDPSIAVRITVFDDRGYNVSESVDTAIRDLSMDGYAARSIIATYGEPGRGRSVLVKAHDLHRGAQDSRPPVFVVSAEGPDGAEVRGLAQEIIERAQRGMPKTPALGMVPQTAPPPTTSASAGVSEERERSKTSWSRALNHPWTVTVVGAIVSGLFLIYLTQWLNN